MKKNGKRCRIYRVFWCLIGITYNLDKSQEDSLCISWTHPQKEELLGIIKQLDTINPYDWGHYYGVFPCGITGEIMYKNTIWNYQLNAGGWLTMNAKKTNQYLYFVCKKKRFKKTLYFN